MGLSQRPNFDEILRGLWHKHYFSARFVAQNMLNELAAGRMEAVIKDTLSTNPLLIITDRIATQLAHRLTVEKIEEREDDERLTGEWIVFAKHGGRNYYLCLAKHDSGDQEVYDRIKSTCVPQFPFLAAAPSEQALGSKETV